MIFDTVFYTTKSYDTLSIKRLQYYISDIKITGDYTAFIDSTFFIDPKKNKNTFTVQGISFGRIFSIEFLIGIRSAKNYTGALPNTTENINMAWPDAMGGGYHFLKMEGHYKKESVLQGYAFHIGTSIIQIPVQIPCSIRLDNFDKTINLEMKLEEWFTNPYTYNLSDKNTSTMGSDSLMNILAQNAQTVFTVIQ